MYYLKPHLCKYGVFQNSPPCKQQQNLHNLNWQAHGCAAQLTAMKSN
jgi:hypothetical protein